MNMNKNCGTEPNLFWATRGSVEMKKTPLKDDYSVSSTVLGDGINGKVCVCHDKDGHKFALKSIKVRNDGRNIARREAHLHWKASGSRHIVAVKDIYQNVIENETYVLIVMECMEGGELFDKIAEKTTFTEREAADIVKDVSLAIKYLHDRDIAHRDLKPENLLYSKDGVLKLTDFGFAKDTRSGDGLKTACYTPYYVAPEVLGSQKYDKSCDIWSLGVIVFILLSGYPPFDTENGGEMSPGMKRRIRTGDFGFPSRYWKDVSENAKDLIRGCLRTDRNNRFTIDEVLASEWISDHTSVPQTPLTTCEVLKMGDRKLLEMNKEMKIALNQMRQEMKTTFKLGLNDSSLAKKRKVLKDSGANDSNAKVIKHSGVDDNEKVVKDNELNSNTKV